MDCITEVTEKDFPLYHVENQTSKGDWCTFTKIPFLTEEEAKKHCQLILQDFPTAILRTAVYTIGDWKRDLIKAISKNPELVLRALSSLSAKTLVQALRGSSDVFEFFTREGVDPYGRTLEDLLQLNDGQLESSHDVIQWLFPLHEPSNFNDEAPLVLRSDYDLLSSDPKAFVMMKKCIIRFAKFLGFDYVQGNFVQRTDLKKNLGNWRRKNNHNHLRITRVIRSLRLFGMDMLAQKFHDAIYSSAVNAGCVSETTAKYWHKALEGELFDSLQTPA